MLLIAALTLWVHRGHTQGADSLFASYLLAQSMDDTPAKDSVLVARYAAYAEYQINDNYPGSEQIIDTLETFALQSAWPKAHGIYLRIKGRFYDNQGNMDEALNYYNLAIDTLRASGPPYDDLASALVGAGFVLLNTQLYQQSYETLREAYRYAREAGDLRNQWITLNFFGDFYYYSAFRQENYDSALYYYLKTDTLVEKYGMYGYYKADNDLGLANVYRRLGRQELSDKYWDRSLETAKEYENYGVIYALYVDKAEIFENQGRLNRALELKLEAYKYVQESGWIEFMARADNHLYWTYKSLGDYESALFHYEKYIEAQDSMRKNEAAARYAELEAKYESNQKEEEIVRLQNQNLQQSRNFLMVLSAIGALLIGLITWTNWNLRKKNATLEKKNKEIMLAQLKGQNLERRRMALELHDNLNTKIAAIRWQLEAIVPLTQNKVHKVLSNTLQLINDVYGDVRLISHNLMPEKVEAIGLIAALESLLKQLKQNNQIAFHLVVHTQPDFDFGSLTYPLYNIIFEMINNILKHANAENGWISISNTEDKILLTVSDDGCGFDIDQMTNGYGIKNITSRLENIKGKWSIDSKPGKGTKFFIEIPLLD